MDVPSECEHRGDQAVEAGFEHVLDGFDVVGRPTDDAARRVAVVERDVETLEVPEDPAAQFQQHLLADASRTAKEEHPADGLHDDDHTQGADDRHQCVGGPTVDDRRDSVVDAALHEKRNRKARSVFHHDDAGEEGDRPAVGPQQ